MVTYSKMPVYYGIYNRLAKSWLRKISPPGEWAETIWVTYPVALSENYEQVKEMAERLEEYLNVKLFVRKLGEET